MTNDDIIFGVVWHWTVDLEVPGSGPHYAIGIFFLLQGALSPAHCNEKAIVGFV